MNPSDLLVGLVEVVGRGLAREVNRDGVLTSRDVKDGRRFGEQGRVLGEVGNSKSGRHDDETERLPRERERQSSATAATNSSLETHLDPFLALLPHLFPQPCHTTQYTNQHIRVDTTFVRLIDNNHRVLVE